MESGSRPWPGQAGPGSSPQAGPEPGLKANISAEPSWRASQEQSRAAPSVIIVKVVCSLRLRLSVLCVTPEPVPEPEPWHHNRSPLILTVTYKPLRGEEQWVHSLESDS